MSTFENLTNALFKPSRQIGPYSVIPPDGVPDLDPFSAQVTIEEVSTDKLTLTSHPVEQGAAITDHAFKEPCELVLRLGWSNSGVTSLANDLTALSTLFSGEGEGGFNHVQEVYNKLLALQLNRIPFNIVTGKRSYKNMMINSMTSPTNCETEHSLIVTLICKEIIIVQTSATSFPSTDVQANPKKTGSVQNLGVKQPKVTNYIPVDGVITMSGVN